MDKYRRRINDISNKRNKYQDKLAKKRLELSNIYDEINITRKSIGKYNEDIENDEKILNKINQAEEKLSTIKKKSKMKSLVYLIISMIISVSSTIAAIAAATPVGMAILIFTIIMFLTSGVTITQETLNVYLKTKNINEFIANNPKYIIEKQLSNSFAQKKKAKNYLKKLKSKSSTFEKEIQELEHIVNELTNYLASMVEARDIALKNVAELDLDDYYQKDNRVNDINRLERKLQNDSKNKQKK